MIGRAVPLYNFDVTCDCTGYQEMLIENDVLAKIWMKSHYKDLGSY